MRVLLVEDDPVLTGVLRASLGDAGHVVDAACRAGEAEHLWRVQPYDAVLLDLNLPDGSGLQVLRSARARRPHAGTGAHGAQPHRGAHRRARRGRR